jgi:hypothetical protein
MAADDTAERFCDRPPKESEERREDDEHHRHERDPGRLALLVRERRRLGPRCWSPRRNDGDDALSGAGCRSTRGRLRCGCACRRRTQDRGGRLDDTRVCCCNRGSRLRRGPRRPYRSDEGGGTGGAIDGRRGRHRRRSRSRSRNRCEHDRRRSARGVRCGGNRVCPCGSGSCGRCWRRGRHRFRRRRRRSRLAEVDCSRVEVVSVTHPAGCHDRVAAARRRSRGIRAFARLGRALDRVYRP